MKRERELFVELVASDRVEGAALYFFAEREAAKVPACPPTRQPRQIEHGGIIGAGTMGGGIAMNFANAGIPVTLLETEQEALERGLGVIRTTTSTRAARGGMTAEDVDKRMALITGVAGLDDARGRRPRHRGGVRGPWRQEGVFTQLDEVAKPGAVLASNTSYLDVNEIAAATKRPEDVIGMHFFSPANVMKL